MQHLENIMNALMLGGIFLIAVSDSVAGVLFRGSFSAPLFWLGAIDHATANAIAFWHLF